MLSANVLPFQVSVSSSIVGLIVYEGADWSVVGKAGKVQLMRYTAQMLSWAHNLLNS